MLTAISDQRTYQSCFFYASMHPIMRWEIVTDLFYSGDIWDRFYKAFLFVSRDRLQTGARANSLSYDVKIIARSTILLSKKLVTALQPKVAVLCYFQRK